RFSKGEFRFSDLKCGWFEIIFSNPIDLKKVWEGIHRLLVEYANPEALSAILELNGFGTLIKIYLIHHKRKWMTFTNTNV
ncbi:hypothetical protein V2J09_003626, partial [Rumex salicifolius]